MLHSFQVCLVGGTWRLRSAIRQVCASKSGQNVAPPLTLPIFLLVSAVHGDAAVSP